MLAEEGMIAPEDLWLFEFAESTEEGWASSVRRGLPDPFLPGRRRTYGLMCVNVTISVTANNDDGKARLAVLQ
jgi:hypothetical protein